MNTLPQELREVYGALFSECGITCAEWQEGLVAFVEGDGELQKDLAAAMDEDERLQEFVERAFALKFAPLQEAVTREQREDAKENLEEEC